MKKQKKPTMIERLINAQSCIDRLMVENEHDRQKTKLIERHRDDLRQIALNLSSQKIVISNSDRYEEYYHE